MLINETKELAESESERLMLEKKSDIYKDSIIEEIINKGLGSSIRDTLRSPIKITRFQIFKFKLKSALKKILNVL